jgi:hypothetical protein
MVTTRARTLATSVALALAAPAGALAQPTVNPYDGPAATPSADNVVIAKALVARARQLLDAGFPEDARKLAEEALLLVGDGDVATQARGIVEAADALLAPPAPDPGPTIIPDPPEPPTDDLDPPEVKPRVDPDAAGRRWISVTGTTLGAALGGGIALAASDDSSGLVAGAAAGGAILGYFGGRFAGEKYRFSEPRARTISSGTMLGSVVGGFVADVADVEGSTAGEIGVGVAVGSLAGLGGGWLVSRSDTLSTGDVALMDTFALAGLLGGLTLGAGMQPAEDEAYSLNAVLGGAGGWIVGALVGPKIDASPRRAGMMALGALALGGAPWLVYLAVKDDETTSDEQGVGLASTAGIVAGLYLGYRLTRGLAGTEVGPHGERSGDNSDEDSTGTALLHRSRSGRWSVSPVLPRPVAADDGSRAWLLDVAGGRF